MHLKLDLPSHLHLKLDLLSHLHTVLARALTVQAPALQGPCRRRICFSARPRQRACQR